MSRVSEPCERTGIDREDFPLGLSMVLCSQGLLIGLLAECYTVFQRIAIMNG